MKRYTIFLDWKNQNCQNDYTTPCNLQIQCNPYPITNGIFFTELEQNILQLAGKHRRPPVAKATRGAGGVSLPDIRLHHRAIVIKTARCWHKDRNTGQWVKIESPEPKPGTKRHLVYDTGSKNIQWRKHNLFN